MWRIKKLYLRLVIASITSLLVTFVIFRTGRRSYTPSRLIDTDTDTDSNIYCDTASGVSNTSLRTAYVITPTYLRLTQEADLLRMCYTLGHATTVHWIVVEDSDNKTFSVTKLLNSCKGVNSTHLVVKTVPATQPPGKKAPGQNGPRGVAQRNMGLVWLRKCVLATSRAGGVYFADDDNTYDVRVFDVVRMTKTLSMWKVGLVGGLLQEGPVCKGGKVTGWRSAVASKRTFSIDMAGFAVGLELIAQFPHAKFSLDAKQGLLESSFLLSLNVTIKDITPAPDKNCSEVLAWHTQTNLPNIRHESKLLQKQNQRVLPKPKFPVVNDDY